MTYDRDVFFGEVRDTLFDGALSQQNVDGHNIILAVYEHNGGGTPMDDTRWLAYMLATTYWETAHKVWPTTEMGSQDYLTGKKYYPYIGRGFVQLTWEDNYRKASSALGLIDDRDLVAHPEMALDSLIATRCLFRGMSEGWFTGAKLGQFFNATEDNPYDARTIINGHDKATEIADIHEQYLAALKASEVKPVAPTMLQTVVIDIQAPTSTEVKVLVNDAEYGA